MQGRRREQLKAIKRTLLVASSLIIDPSQLTNVQSYLISWHGLMAYVSRLDTTHEYLEQLKQGSNRLQEMKPPRVRRSRLLNLTKTQDRIELATLAARIAVEQLSRYTRNWNSGLIPRLKARHDQGEGDEACSLLGPSLGGGGKSVSRELRDRLCGDCRSIVDSYESEQRQ